MLLLSAKCPRPFLADGKTPYERRFGEPSKGQFYLLEQWLHGVQEVFLCTVCEAVQGLSNLFTISLQIDDVQDFDVSWDQALLSASEMPSDVILEGLYKSKLQDSVQLQIVLALNDQETVSCKTSNLSNDENSKLQSTERSCGKKISHRESRRKESQR